MSVERDDRENDGEGNDEDAREGMFSGDLSAVFNEQDRLDGRGFFEGIERFIIDELVSGIKHDHVVIDEVGENGIILFFEGRDGVERGCSGDSSDDAGRGERGIEVIWFEEGLGEEFEEEICDKGNDEGNGGRGAKHLGGESGVIGMSEGSVSCVHEHGGGERAAEERAEEPDCQAECSDDGNGGKDWCEQSGEGEA